MGAPLGNKYAEGNKGGRPRTVAIEDLPLLGEALVADFEKALDTLDEHKTPKFLGKWFRMHGMSDDTAKNYCEANEEFFGCYKRAKEIQKEMIILGGMKGYWNPTFTIFTAKNITDMRDSIDHTTKGEKMNLGVVMLPSREGTENTLEASTETGGGT